MIGRMIARCIFCDTFFFEQLCLGRNFASVIIKTTIPERERAHVVNQTMPKGKRVARCNSNRHVRGRRALVCPRENKLRVVTRTTMFEEKLHALRLKHL